MYVCWLVIKIKNKKLDIGDKTPIGDQGASIKIILPKVCMYVYPQGTILMEFMWLPQVFNRKLAVTM